MASPRSKIILLAFLLLTLFAAIAAASTPEPPAVPRDYVVDLAGVMSDSAKTQLNALLRELEQKTTAQVLVLTIQSLDNEEIRSFGLKIAEKWKLGQKGKDNGALLVVAMKDRKYTIEVGYGLEGTLPDSLVGTIGREYLVPFFKKGDYSSGIYTATLAIIQTVASSEGVQISGMPALPRQTRGRQQELDLKGLIYLIIPLIPFFYIFVRCPLEANRKRIRGYWTGGYSGFGGGGSGGFGGGFGGFGGGGGGFGGGGGGGFGGGGSSGGW